MSEVSQPKEQLITEIGLFWNMQSGRTSTVRNKRDDINFLLSQLQQTKEELKLSSQSHEHAERDLNRTHTQLEQAKAERDYALRGSTCDACRGVIGENDKLRTELSAKNEILKMVATGDYVYPLQMRAQVRSILSQYGDTHE